MNSKPVFNNFLPIWVDAPMLRLLMPLMAGIMIQWYFPVSIVILKIVTVILLITALILHFSKNIRYKLLLGIVLQVLLITLGAWLIHLNDNKNSDAFIGKHYKDSATVVATLQEPLTEKTKSYKAEATVQILDEKQLQPVKGRIIVYIQKDSNKVSPQLNYGSTILFNKPLQSIKNAGNPGGFDYQRYCAFHELYYQVFLKQGDYIIENTKTIQPFRQFLFDMQQWVLQLFRKNIPEEKEAGVAEALLIGYRNDLDRELVQSYSNTGVVHIIAISGMHLGLIYGLMILLFRPLGKSRKILLLKSVTIIAVLWLFSILTGAAPSIVRSAIMFTFIVLGEAQKRKSSIYNNLALSAFLILLYDPFSLWDVGFQLSYSAVLSIAVFAKPITKMLYIKNKWLSNFWQLNAVTISAQILTYPIVVYHFHQFPNLFLITNLIAVPLSSIILYGLLLLLAVSWLPAAAGIVGKISQWLIWLMNAFIEKVDTLPFALTDGILFSIPQAIILFILIVAISWWLFYKSSKAFVMAAFSLMTFISLKTFDYIFNVSQHKLIIYNVPQHAAIDLINGKSYLFVGDTILTQDGFLQNFHLKPSRIEYQIKQTQQLENINIKNNIIQAGSKKMLILKNDIEPFLDSPLKPDILIISANPKLKLSKLLNVVQPQIIVADATNSNRKISLWQKEADSLHLQFHAVANEGAFITDW